MAAGDPLRHTADRNLPSRGRVHLELVRGCPVTHCDSARPPPARAAAPGRRKVASRDARKRLSARLRMRNSLVRRDLLLGVQHHEAIRRHRYSRRHWSADSVLPLSGPVSRCLRAGHQSAGEKIPANGSPAGSVPLGCGRACAHPHHRISLGVAGNGAGG